MPADSTANPLPHTPTLYLIDGYAQFFRAYHAIRTPMTSPVTKEPTNMSFGFIGMLLKLLRGEGKVGTVPGQEQRRGPDFVAVTLDVSGDRGTFRSELYPEYKANRSAPPEDLGPQVERCLATLRLMKVPILGAEGFEADDVIATIVDNLRASHPDLRVRIISKDKDLKQLLSAEGGGVELYDVHNDELITEITLHAETGLKPKQIIDYLALMGDNVDNVPGVEGVGPKTAAQLIAEYGSLDAVVAEAMSPTSRIKGKRLENIRAAASRLPLSRTLVTLRHDAPVSLDLASATVAQFDLPALQPVLRELGFNRYQDELAALINPRATQSHSTPTSAPTSKPAATPREPAPIFGGLFDQLADAPSSTSNSDIRPQSGEYRSITSERELRELVGQMRDAEVISIDTETTGLSPLRDHLAGVCISLKAGTGVYIPVRSPSPKDHLDEAAVLGALRPVLEDPTRPKCGHNLKFDALVLRRAGVRLAGFTLPAVEPLPEQLASAGSVLPDSTVFDSMIASYLIDSERSSHGLDALALALLNRTNISITRLIGSGKDQRRFDQVPLEQATQYAAEDADVALQLRERMLPQLRAMGLYPLFSRVEMPLVAVLAKLEWNGIRVDRDELDRQRTRLQGRIDALRREIVAYAEDHLQRPFNPDSPKQLAAVLFNKPDATDEQGGPGFGIKPVKRIKTGYSTDAEVLETLAEDPSINNPIPGLIVEHRELSKLVGTYLLSLRDDIYPDPALDPRVLPEHAGRIHASFHQTVAATGRLSSSDPNLQNIPIRTDQGREIRRAFVASPGHLLVSADYSQIELRLLAHLARDPALVQAFADGQDIHTAVAAQINNVPLEQVTKSQRSAAKMVNFGIVYGVTPFGLARRLGIATPAAEEIIVNYKKRFAGITTFLQECVDQAHRFGYVLTMLGRRRPISDIASTNPSRRSAAERAAINSVVQGSAADLIKLAMVDLEGRIDAGEVHARMLLQIHDELVFECEESLAEQVQTQVVSAMERAMVLSVPLRADARSSRNWFEGK